MYTNTSLGLGAPATFRCRGIRIVDTRSNENNIAHLRARRCLRIWCRGASSCGGTIISLARNIAGVITYQASARNNIVGASTAAFGAFFIIVVPTSATTYRAPHGLW